VVDDLNSFLGKSPKGIAIEVAKVWVGYDKLLFVMCQWVGEIELFCKASLRCRGLALGRTHGLTLQLDQQLVLG
jgi:hypothetical protein